jgi:hypothetical protein
MLADGGQADDPTQFDSSDPIFNQPQQQQRQPGQVEGMMKAINQWGQGPSGVSQRFANPGLYDIERASYELQQNVDSDTAEKLQKHTNKMIDDVQNSDTPGLPPGLKRAQGGNVMATKQSERFNPYKRPSHNSPRTNDPGSSYQPARGGGTYTWGKYHSVFQTKALRFNRMVITK